MSPILFICCTPSSSELILTDRLSIRKILKFLEFSKISKEGFFLFLETLEPL